MLAATAWDDSDWEGARARGWTVMGRLRERQQLHRDEAVDAKRRVAQRAKSQPLSDAASCMFDARSEGGYRDVIKANWADGPTVLAFLFAHPDSSAIRMLDAHGEYFNVRTGDAWDLFFPGYYSSRDPGFERRTGARAVGRGFAGTWFFSPSDFDMLRSHVERASGGRWAFSGGTDLVLVNGWMPQEGEPVIDWASTKSGTLSEGAASSNDTIGHVIERISRDLETGAEDASYGVGDIIDRADASGDSDAKKVMIGALGGIAAALGKRGLGI